VYRKSFKLKKGLSVR